ncbi:MAG: zf-HC2 domain-containing protein, partial [Chlorobi bacterium]|nr:zf-HC2 domain-containing protein [Chlorobiota bacterium]
MKTQNTNTNKSCEEIQLLIDDYLDGMISTEDRNIMNSHIAGCTECKKYLEDTVVILEKAALLSRLPAERHGDANMPSKGKKTEMWNKIEFKISSVKPAGDTHIYNMSGLEDEYIPYTSKDETAKQTKTGGWGSFRYYISGIAAVLVLAFVIFGVTQFLKRGSDTVITDGIVDVASPHWKVVPIKGNPMINNLVMKAYDSLGIGGYIVTDDSSRAELYVANLGSVIMEPNTKVKLVKSTEGEHRIELDYGSIDASIIASPRSFYVDAGNVTAVDLGCSYKFSMDKNGDGLLYVRSGMVALESASGRESIVPEGKYCVTKKDVGPGTPFREDSAPELKKALMEFDFGNCGAQCVNVILKNANKNDAV